MSEENVKTLRDSFRFFETGDWEQFDSLLDDDTVLTGPEDWPETGRFEGKAAVMRQMKRLASDWEEHYFDDFAVVADERGWIVLEYRWHVRGAGSGIEATLDVASAHRIEEGRLVEGHFRLNRADALQAAGLLK